MNNAHHHNNICLQFVIIYNKYFPFFGHTGVLVEMYTEIATFCLAVFFFFALKYKQFHHLEFNNSFDRSFIHPFVHSFILDCSLHLEFGETNEVITSNGVTAVRLV